MIMAYLKPSKNNTQFLLDSIQISKMILAFKKKYNISKQGSKEDQI